MTIHQLLADFASEKPLKHSVICLSGESYPILFCAQWIEYLKKKHTILSPSLDDVSSLQAQLGTSFLGNSSWYWLHSFDELSKQNKQTWFSYLYSYNGPHTIFFFSSEVPHPISSSSLVIKIPSHADAELITHMLAWYNGKAQTAISLVKKIMSTHDKIPVDTAVLLIQYALVMGSRSQEFLDSWLNFIIPSPASLFSISEALFAKKPRQFFTNFSSIQDYYVPQFWISFWSEQLWRASFYVVLMQSHKYAEAKRIGFRLPFSFLNRDWRRYSVKELKQAHHVLYDIDYELKHGADPVALELFYSKFMTGSFSS